MARHPAAPTARPEYVRPEYVWNVFSRPHSNGLRRISQCRTVQAGRDPAPGLHPPTGAPIRLPRSRPRRAAAAPPPTLAVCRSRSATTTPDRAAREQAIETALNEAAGQVSSLPLIRDALAQQLIAAWQLLSQEAAALTDRYNQAEEQGLVAARGNIARVDINGLFNEVIDNPRLYGLSNTAGMACPHGVSSMDCTSSTPGFSLSQQYLFADRLHPSPVVHWLNADYMLSVLLESLTLAALGQAPPMMVGH